MNIFHDFAADLDAVLSTLPITAMIPPATRARATVEPPRDASHGDISTNAAMVLSKEARTNPRALGEAIAAGIVATGKYAKVEVAGPGFINVTLKPEAFEAVVHVANALGADYGRSSMGGNEKINVEYVSANPTGPMHVGHGRGAVYGDALANLLAFAGYDVTREYYINDAGAQVDVLARSAFHRYREALGRNVGEVGEGLYPGDYLIPVGKQLAYDFGDSLESLDESEWLPKVRQYAIESMLVMILSDLEAIDIKFDVFFSEKSLSEKTVLFKREYEKPVFYCSDSFDLIDGPASGVRGYFAKKDIDEAVKLGKSPTSKLFSATTVSGKMGGENFLESVLADFRARDLIYEGRLPPPKGQKDEDWEDREQTLFRATQFGDDVDRPLLKADGGYTYFASDIAYHASKFERGFAKMIDVWGADHGGYVKRMQAAVKAATDNAGNLEVRLAQMVRLMRGGEPVKMSKRAGSFVTLRDVIDEVGRDPIRFMMLNRTNDAELDFDLAKVLEQSKDNPVFYVQYAHARICSVFRQADAAFGAVPILDAEMAGADLSILKDEYERALIRLVAAFPRLIEQAATTREPHRVVFYLSDLASAFHGLWNRGKDLPDLKFINNDDRKGTSARLALVKAAGTVIANGLKLLGVSAPQEMR
ncbi:MAG: arginine--tRNA ligase [Proteobacteria bacterium]|nr:arginine--tRNA ligase [Pseudomonadota bacterium]